MSQEPEPKRKKAADNGVSESKVSIEEEVERHLALDNEIWSNLLKRMLNNHVDKNNRLQKLNNFEEEFLSCYDKIQKAHRALLVMLINERRVENDETDGMTDKHVGRAITSPPENRDEIYAGEAMGTNVSDLVLKPNLLSNECERSDNELMEIEHTTNKRKTANSRSQEFERTARDEVKLDDELKKDESGCSMSDQLDIPSTAPTSSSTLRKNERQVFMKKSEEIIDEPMEFGEFEKATEITFDQSKTIDTGFRNPTKISELTFDGSDVHEGSRDRLDVTMMEVDHSDSLRMSQNALVSLAIENSDSLDGEKEIIGNPVPTKSGHSIAGVEVLRPQELLDEKRKEEIICHRLDTFLEEMKKWIEELDDKKNKKTSRKVLQTKRMLEILQGEFITNIRVSTPTDLVRKAYKKLSQLIEDDPKAKHGERLQKIMKDLGYCCGNNQCFVTQYLQCDGAPGKKKCWIYPNQEYSHFQVNGKDYDFCNRHTQQQNDRMEKEKVEDSDVSKEINAVEPLEECNGCGNFYHGTCKNTGLIRNRNCKCEEQEAQLISPEELPETQESKEMQKMVGNKEIIIRTFCWESQYEECQDDKDDKTGMKKAKENVRDFYKEIAKKTIENPIQPQVGPWFP